MNTQFGFRKQYSTSLALTHLINQISSSADEGKITAGVFLDLSKAFDTIDHDIFLTKLEHYGIRGLPLNWLRNYLDNRKQFVYINDICLLHLRI